MGHHHQISKHSGSNTQHLLFDDGHAGLDTLLVISNRTVLTQPPCLSSHLLVLGHLRTSVGMLDFQLLFIYFLS